MKTKKLNQKQRGFTIIEVMIVLTIAAVILLIVFLAVPALQRSSRNTQRKNDVAAILASVNDYASNNQGQFPATAADGQFNTAYPNQQPNLSYYTDVTKVTWTKQASATAPADPADLDTVAVYSNAKCAGNGPTVTGANARSVIALYDVEGSGGSKVEQCQES
ncbi:MAG TPA: type II secretion system protein [Candidatus Saccharimonadales bacterium]|nr:type II secretion system protein [Candidatus Saccharimonadales bacterium]